MKKKRKGMRAINVAFQMTIKWDERCNQLRLRGKKCCCATFIHIRLTKYYITLIDHSVSIDTALLTTPLLPLLRPVQPHRILQALRRYVRAENKDRQHTIRHYQHVLAVDPEKAAQMKSQVSFFSLTITWFDAGDKNALYKRANPTWFFFWVYCCVCRHEQRCKQR